MISGSAAGVGKSMLVLGLVHALKRQGIGISLAILGPSLAHAAILRRTVGRFVTMLDDRILTAGQNLAQLKHASSGAELIIIDGQRGLYDGAAPGALRGSDSEMATLTKTPVALVIDARGFGNSISALVKGYSDFAKGFNLAGVVLNRLPRENLLLTRKEFESSLSARNYRAPLGVLPELGSSQNLSGDALSEGRNMTSLERQFLVELSTAVSANVDLAALLEVARQVEPVPLPGLELNPSPRRTRIAYSDDGCFNLNFQDNLELLRYFGAELVPFSPLTDTELPGKIGGIYLTGGFLIDYARELAANTALHTSIRNFVERGGVLYAEGAGAALCAQEVHAKDHAGEQVRLGGLGLLGGVAQHNSLGSRSLLQRERYIEGVTVEESILGRSGLIIKGYGSGEWRLMGEDSIPRVLRLSKVSTGSVHEGFSPRAQVVLTFNFLHFGSNRDFAKNLVDAAEVVQRI